MDGMDLTDAIEILRSEILAAHAKSSPSAQFPIQSITLQLKVGLTKSVDGKAGFKVPIINAELGASGGLHSEKTQTVTLVLGPPVDSRGQPVRVGQDSDELKG